MGDRPVGGRDLLNLWCNTNEPIDDDGKFWKVKQGGISLPSYTEGGPKLRSLATPGRRCSSAPSALMAW